MKVWQPLNLVISLATILLLFSTCQTAKLNKHKNQRLLNYYVQFDTAKNSPSNQQHIHLVENPSDDTIEWRKIALNPETLNADYVDADKASKISPHEISTSIPKQDYTFIDDSYYWELVKNDQPRRPIPQDSGAVSDRTNNLSKLSANSGILGAAATFVGVATEATSFLLFGHPIAVLSAFGLGAIAMITGYLSLNRGGSKPPKKQVKQSARLGIALGAAPYAATILVFLIRLLGFLFFKAIFSGL